MAHLIITKFHEQVFEEFKFEQEKMIKQVKKFENLRSEVDLTNGRVLRSRELSSLNR